MNILFCGSNTSLEMNVMIKHLSEAANRYQHNFIKALAEEICLSRKIKMIFRLKFLNIWLPVKRLFPQNL